MYTITYHLDVSLEHWSQTVKVQYPNRDIFCLKIQQEIIVEDFGRVCISFVMPEELPLPRRPLSASLNKHISEWLCWCMFRLSVDQVIVRSWSCASDLSGPPCPSVCSSGGTPAGRCSWRPLSSSPWRCRPTRCRWGSKDLGGAPQVAVLDCCRNRGRPATLSPAPSSTT